MAGFTFNITDMSEMMNAKDIVTKKIIELVKTNPYWNDKLVKRIATKINAQRKKVFPVPGFPEKTI